MKIKQQNGGSNKAFGGMHRITIGEECMVIIAFLMYMKQQQLLITEAFRVQT